MSSRGASSRVVLGRLFSSRDVQYGSPLVEFPSDYSLVLAWIFTLVVVGVNSVVAVGLILSNCDVQAPL